MIDNSDPYDKPAGTKVWVYIRSAPHHQSRYLKEDRIKSLIAEKVGCWTESSLTSVDPEKQTPGPLSNK